MNQNDNKKFRFLSLFVILLLAVIALLSYQLYQLGNKFQAIAHNANGFKPSKRENSVEYSAPSSRKSSYILNSQNNNQLLDPYTEMERMQEYINQLFTITMDRFQEHNYDEDLQRFNFNLNGEVEEDNRYYVLNISVPNVKTDSIDIKVNEKQLQLKGTNEEFVEEKDSKGNVIHSETKSTSFLRTINFPEKVDPNSLDKKVENGMLQIKLKKLNSKS